MLLCKDADAIEVYCVSYVCDSLVNKREHRKHVTITLIMKLSFFPSFPQLLLIQAD
jgi:hypothetical protein